MDSEHRMAHEMKLNLRRKRKMKIMRFDKNAFETHRFNLVLCTSTIGPNDFYIIERLACLIQTTKKSYIIMFLTCDMVKNVNKCAGIVLFN